MSYLAGISRNDELYQDLVTFAPISGVVGLKQVKIGEQVTSGPTGINPAFVIYRIDRVKVLVDVPEKNLSALHVGMIAEIVLDAYPDEKFSGKINNIRPVIDPLSRTTQVEIVIPNPGYRIKPGMFCQVNFILKEKDNVLIVPDDAVLGDEQKYVYVAVADRAVSKNIQIGLKEENKDEVISGLTEQDQLITVGQRVVENGSKVEVKSE
jgi:RND family efflux transporter MFP subunit